MDDSVSVQFASFIATLDGFSSIGNDGAVDGKCSMTGAMGSVLNDMVIKGWLDRGNNCTLVSFLNFQGLKDSMRIKESDATMIATRIYELDDEYIEYTNPLYDEFLLMICSYNYTEHMTPQDLTDAYLEFHWSYYALLLLTLIVFISAWKVCEIIGCKLSDRVRKEVKKSRLSSYWIMVCGILDQDQFPLISRSAFTLLSICFSVFFFITIDSYMLNIMRAELVLIDEPQVVVSYQDIKERDDLQVLFIKGFGEEIFFKDSPKGTIEHEIWKKRYILEDFSIESIQKVWQPVIDQKIIGLSRSWISRGAANLGLTKMREMGIDYIRAIETKDETGKFFTNACMLQKDAPKQLKDYYKKRIYQIAQSGIYEWFVIERIPHLFGGGSETVLDQFSSTSLFLPEPPEPEIKRENITKFYRLYLCMVALSLVVLLYEVLDFKIRSFISGIEAPKKCRTLKKVRKVKVKPRPTSNHL